MGAQITVFGAQNIFDSLLPLAKILPKSVYVPLSEFPVLVLRLFAVPMYGLPEPKVPSEILSPRSLGAVAMLCISSPKQYAFICHRQRHTALSTTAIYVPFPVQPLSFCRLSLVRLNAHKREQILIF